MKTKRIVQLSPLIANQIAAGEVIERAASVVKELVENSIDAKATKIEIDIEGAGVHLIRIRDNGEGIIKEDLPLVFSRHATSKITSSDDLARINSLGFRGEALASIASVAKCRLTSRAKAAKEAWQLILENDLTYEVVPSAHSEGTTFEVADLFYNTPVRRKFLRSEKAEALAIEEMIKRLALSAPHISFSIKQNQKTRHYPAAYDELSERLRVGKICGQAFIEKASKLSLEAEGLSLQGWIGCPSLCKRQADSQYFFVNRRMVKDKVLNHAIKLLYQEHPECREGTHPSYILFLNIDPFEVDVNVHPTKQEVRFSQSRRIHDFISAAVRQAWSCPVAGVMPVKTFRTGSIQCEKQEEKTKAKPLKRYVFIEKNEGVYIIDLIRSKSELTQLYFDYYANNIPTKPLLFPLSIKLSIRNSLSEETNGWLKEYGFECRKGKEEVMLLKQPACLNKPLLAQQLIEIISEVGKNPNRMALLSALAKVLPGDWLNQVDWSQFDLKAMPFIFFSHEDIQNVALV